MMEFSPFDTVKITLFACRILSDFLPNLSSGQWFYCLWIQRKYFASKEIINFSRIEHVFEGIGPFWRLLGPLPSVTDGRTDGRRLSRPKPPPPSRRKFSSRGRAAAPPHSNKSQCPRSVVIITMQSWLQCTSRCKGTAQGYVKWQHCLRDNGIQRLQRLHTTHTGDYAWLYGIMHMPNKLI